MAFTPRSFAHGKTNSSNTMLIQATGCFQWQYLMFINDVTQHHHKFLMKLTANIQN